MVNTLLLFYDSKGYVRNLELLIFKNTVIEIAFTAHWTCHFARYFCPILQNEDLIKGIFGHDEVCRNRFHRYSGFEATDYDQIRAAQDKLVELFKV